VTLPKTVHSAFDGGQPEMTKLVHITTLPQTAASFLQGQLSWLQQQGFQVTVMSSPGAQLEEFARREGICWQALPTLRRNLSPWHDTRAVRELADRLRELAPQIVHAHTPKAGLIGMAAAAIANVPVRIYQLHGLRFETSLGWRRAVLKSAERITCRLADRVICVSPSLRRRCLEEGLFDEQRSTVLCHGSVNGIDVEAFAGHDDLHQLRHETRQRMGIPADALCLGFVGRLVSDKGVVELHQAWRQLRAQFPSLHLLIVGPFELHDAVPPAVQHQLQHDRRVHLTGLDWNTRGYYAAMDVFTLPSHREGLGHVLLEAGAMGLPVVSCRVTGCVDAVCDGRTGRLIPRGDAVALAKAIAMYLGDADLRRRHGQAGREWVKRRFAQQPIWHALHQEYLRLVPQSSLVALDARPAA
jgi:glycosyltransferase involved in cell wall biosynthesis